MVPREGHACRRGMARITGGGRASVRAIGEIARRMGKKKIVQDGEKIIKRYYSPFIVFVYHVKPFC